MKNKKMDEQLLKPLKDMQKAAPSPALFKRIKSSIFDTQVISMERFRWIAASVLILIAANIYALRQSLNKAESSSTETLITDFTIYNYED